MHIQIICEERGGEELGGGEEAGKGVEGKEGGGKT